VLYDCEFGNDLEWVYEADWHEDNIRHLQHMWAQHAIRATMLKRMLDDLDQAKVETGEIYGQGSTVSCSGRLVCRRL
jgi:tRNA pseudouridine38/39 synthase